MRILLIDADSTIPNLAIMRLSAFYKNKGANISFRSLGLSYYPSRKKRTFIIKTAGYDKIYASHIFEGTSNFVLYDNERQVIKGGSGTDLKIILPIEIEKTEPDYSVYPQNDTSYGFITRGCFRNCYFCKVPEKEGKLRQVASIQDIVKHKKVIFFDNNILAFPGHLKILEELVSKKIRCEFNQGLDIRCLNKDNSNLLKQLNYSSAYTFSFDHYNLASIIRKKLLLLSWAKKWGLRFFVYVDPKRPLSDLMNRIYFLRTQNILVYMMRDLSCWNSQYNSLYTDLAGWCNQPKLFKNMNFSTFIEKKHSNDPERVSRNKHLYYHNITNKII